MSQEVISFVLRFVREAGEAQDARWRGSVKHVQSAAERQFSQFSEALNFMQSQLNDSVQAAVESSSAVNTPWLETARLWGEFVPQVNRIVLEQMNEALSRSASLPADLGRSFGSGRSGSESAEAKLDALSEQLTRLSSAVEALQGEIRELKARRN